MYSIFVSPTKREILLKIHTCVSVFHSASTLRKMSILRVCSFNSTVLSHFAPGSYKKQNREILDSIRGWIMFLISSSFRQVVVSKGDN